MGSGARASRPISNERAAGISRTQSAGESFSREASRLGESNGRGCILSKDTHDRGEAGKRLQRQQDQQSEMGGMRSRNKDRRNGTDWEAISLILWRVGLAEAFSKNVLMSTCEIFEISMGRNREEGHPRRKLVIGTTGNTGIQSAINAMVETIEWSNR